MSFHYQEIGIPLQPRKRRSEMDVRCGFEHHTGSVQAVSELLWGEDALRAAGLGSYLRTGRGAELEPATRGFGDQTPFALCPRI